MKKNNKKASFIPVIAKGQDIREIVKSMMPKYDGSQGWKALIQKAEMFLIYNGPKLGFVA